MSNLGGSINRSEVVSRGRAWKDAGLSFVLALGFAVNVSACGEGASEHRGGDAAAGHAGAGGDEGDREESQGLDEQELDDAGRDIGVISDALSSYPGGSWVKTCPDRTVRYDNHGYPAQIIAYCYSRKHKLVKNEVWAWGCSTGCFWNNNGHLTCGTCP